MSEEEKRASMGLGSMEFAAELHNAGRLYHDRNFRGPEVVFMAFNQTATPEMAHKWWQNSPPHARLINADLIIEVQCYGSAAVGRGMPLGQMTDEQRATVLEMGQDLRERKFIVDGKCYMVS